MGDAADADVELAEAAGGRDGRLGEGVEGVADGLLALGELGDADGVGAGAEASPLPEPETVTERVYAP